MKINLMREILLCGLLLTFISCGSSIKKAGLDFPKELNITKLENIFNNSKEYNNKNIILKGNFSLCCADGDCSEFNFKEGTYVIKVEAGSFSVPKLKEGHPIKIYGEVKSTAESSYIQALGIEFK